MRYVEVSGACIADCVGSVPALTGAASGGRYEFSGFTRKNHMLPV
jgi:hypothetical protein